MQKSRWILSRGIRLGWILSAGSLALTTLPALAVRAQAPPPRPGFHMAEGGPPMFDFMGGKTVAGQPYSAQVTFKHNQTLQDGNLVEQTNTAMVYRDSQGRTRIEETRPTQSGNSEQIVRITDPAARVSYVLDPVKKTAHRFTLPPPRATNLQQPPRAGSNPNVTTQSLGSQTIDGLLVQGTQITRTIPAGQMGNTAPIQTVSTRWYSTDLSIDLSTSTTDPLHGNSSTTLADLSRDEPASTLFQVPSDYTVVNAGPGTRNAGPRPSFAPPLQ
jgi:hypothetical protein